MHHHHLAPAKESALVDRLLQRARSEFLEMPGLRLTQAHAARLWSLDPELFAALLARLVESRFLARTSDDAFVRAS
jgi:hypothetical protein